MSITHDLPVVVVGSGPVGLAAAAHLLERELDVLVLEAADAVAAGVASWSHVQLFSPWRFSVDDAARRLLEPTGWTAPDPDDHATGGELRERYLLPLAATPRLARRIRLEHRVVAVTRRATDKMKDAGRAGAPFELLVRTPRGTHRLLARAVIDASGTLSAPNPLGSAGIAAIGEAEVAGAGRIAYGIPDVRAARDRYAGRRVLVVGAGHSAMNVLQDLVAVGARTTWAVRRRADDDLFGGGAADGLPERGRLGQAIAALAAAGDVELQHGVRVQAVSLTGENTVSVVHDDGVLGPFDEIIAATGFRPDLAMVREVRLDLDPSVEAPRKLAPLIDPNLHSCGSVPPHGEAELRHPEEGFYVAGMKSYGRAPTFLMLTGYEQVRSIAAELAGDHAAAARVELLLPETGVCKSRPRDDAPAGQAGCCVPELASAAVT